MQMTVWVFTGNSFLLWVISLTPTELHVLHDTTPSTKSKVRKIKFLLRPTQIKSGRINQNLHQPTFLLDTRITHHTTL